MDIILKNFQAVNEGEIFKGSLIIHGGKILRIFKGEVDDSNFLPYSDYRIIDLEGKYLLPGIIDDHVHFRDPGLTYKGDIFTESRAAAAGGITSFMDMPNTVPNATTLELLEEKYESAGIRSLINYSFYLGGSNHNIEDILKADPSKICGLKLFMGSSTGNMLVDNEKVLQRIFAESPLLIAVHCEEESIVKKNAEYYRSLYGEDVPMKFHGKIRSEEACYVSSAKAVALSEKYNSRLHILHISTARELALLRNNIPLKEKKITGEVCVHHIWFNEDDYEQKGKLIKWNPAIKSEEDRELLFNAVCSNLIDVIATDHAPHTFEEKQRPYFQAPSGAPLVQHSLLMMIEFYLQGKISMEHIVEKMCHHVADLFRIENRGYIKEGYYADLCVVDLDAPWTVSRENIRYKCGWSPMEGYPFRSSVTHTFVNGEIVYENGKFHDETLGKRINFVV